MNIDVVKMLESIGYSSGKSAATKIFQGYECEIEKARGILAEQSKKKGKFQEGYIRLVSQPLNKFMIGEGELTAPTKLVKREDMTGENFLSDGSDHVKDVRRLVYDKIFVPLAKDKKDGMGKLEALIAYLEGF